MMTRILFSRCATVAIAASLALPAIPAIAQDTVTAEPVIVLPGDPAPATAPAPRITLPETTEAPVMAPEMTDVPKPEVTTAARTRATTAARTPVASSAKPVAASRSAAPAAAPQVETAAPAMATTAQADTAPVAVAPQPVVSPANTAADSSTDELALAGIFGALGLLAVGGIAFAASRRRRNRVASGEVYQPVANEQVDEPIADEPLPATPEPVIEQPAYSAPIAAAPAMTRSNGNGDPVALPAEMPETFAEREALLQELVDAKPDKANPFTSPRARARRAKLIMQSLGRSFTDRKPRIDLSEYTNRWPSLRGWQPATA